MAAYQPSFPGIASATGTRVDSASKHILQCKVNDTLLASWCCDQRNARNTLHVNKMKYCVHKDELVLNVGMPLTEKGSILNSNYAYPSVLSTLGDMSQTAKKVIVGLYAEGKTGPEFMRTKQRIADACASESTFRKMMNVKANEELPKVLTEVKNMPYFQAQGYALGIAYASSLSGDTVASVLIGGMATVMNGHFPCRAGQMLQFYFDFEANAFHLDSGKYPAGTRKRGGHVLFNNNEKVLEGFLQAPKLSAQDDMRDQFHKRQLGTEDSFGEAGTGPGSMKRNIAYPKPYMLDEDGMDHYGDKIRIFCRCINGGRAHEPIDIMLMTQSL